MAKSGGQPGNTNARRGKAWRDALERALARVAEGKVKTVDAGLDRVADVVVSGALAGDKDAWKEIADRVDGKVTQPLSNDEENPLIPDEIVVRVIRPTGRTEEPAQTAPKPAVRKKAAKKKTKKKRARRKK